MPPPFSPPPGQPFLPCSAPRGGCGIAIQWLDGGVCRVEFVPPRLYPQGSTRLSRARGNTRSGDVCMKSYAY